MSSTGRLRKSWSETRPPPTASSMKSGAGSPLRMAGTTGFIVPTDARKTSAPNASPAAHPPEQYVPPASGKYHSRHKPGHSYGPLNGKVPAMQLDPFNFVQRVRSKVAFSAVGASYEGHIFDNK